MTEVDPLKYKLPFETFAGVDGAKTPIFCFNFSGEYCNGIHQYVDELFGANHVLRGGPFEMYNNITADAVAKYCRKRDCWPHPITMSRLEYYVLNGERCTEIYPVSTIIVPAEREIYEFSPFQRPSDDTDNESLIAHFDSYWLRNTLLQIDCSSHDTPTLLKRLEEVTGINAERISRDDKKTYS